MAATGSFNMEDPAKQEQIRRAPHKYIPTAGKHGAYVPEPYKHQEYPKMMASALKDAKGNPKYPQPRPADFQKHNGVIVSGDIQLANYQAAMAEWDRFMQSSIVNSKAEENAWLKENG